MSRPGQKKRDFCRAISGGTFKGSFTSHVKDIMAENNIILGR
jgi:hypothetical protein